MAAVTPLRIALAGLVALAVAMGIGRFAFTPILPMMLADGVVDLPYASWLASTNYLGYLAGAVLVTVEPSLRRRLAWRQPRAVVVVRGGLVATALLTAAMALPWPAAWPSLRFAAGVASAYVLVQSSGWCLAQLAARGAPSLGGVMFAGPGAGIVASGLVAGVLVAWRWSSSAAWAAFGVLAAALSAAVWSTFRDAPAADVPAAVPHAAMPTTDEAAPRAAAEVATLAVAYGLAGFGYIVTATFLPVIARAAIAGSPLIDLFWPIFGAGIVVGALLASRLRRAVDRRWLLVVAYLVQATGIGIGIVSPTEAGFAIGSALLGLPFTAITFFVAQEARRVRPRAAASTIGLVTALYALGQAAGPPMVAALLKQAGGDAHLAFQRSLAVAAGALVAGAALFAVSARRWPLAAPTPR